MRDHLGIYLHWPFCLSKCPYCDFNSHVAANIDHAAWHRSLLAELDHFARETSGREVTSIFFGGGTPSLMEPDLVAALLERIAHHWRLADDIEITLEANPGAAEADRFRGFRAAGVNRLSLGIQALNAEALRFLGRKHDLGEAMAALERGRAVFPRLSFDLIYCRPGQSVDAWDRELHQALSIAADHLSLYQLTIEEGTAFDPAYKRGDFQLPDEDIAAELFALTHERCAAVGLPAYEVSNHAKPGAECRHNLVYWQGGDWLGIGPGAHGRMIDESGSAWAIRQIRAPHLWLGAVADRGHGTEERVALDPVQHQSELVMMGLRLRRGLDAAYFARRTGAALKECLDPVGLERMISGGFVEWDEKRLRATDSGFPLLNSVIAALLPAG